jgi:hypothetical protein
MRKTSVLTAALAAAWLLGACAARHGIGLVNNELAWRMGYGDVTAEVTLGTSTDNSFYDTEADLPGLFYAYTENGSVSYSSWLGLAGYYRLFSSSIFSVSAGLKYGNEFVMTDTYEYKYSAYSGYRKYEYTETFEFFFFSRNRLGIILPDVEISSPFSDNLKFTFNVELLYMLWTYAGGKYSENFSQSVSTVEAYKETTRSVLLGPGQVGGVSIGSGLFTLGRINAGLMYYF